jgi:hypothetical protein
MLFENGHEILVMTSMGPKATNINMIVDSHFQSRTLTLAYIKLLWKFIWTHRITAGHHHIW